MIIDFHTHTFPPAIAEKVLNKLSEAADVVTYTDSTNEGLLASMNEAGIDLSIVLPVVTNPAHHSTINDTAKRLNERFAEVHEQIFSSNPPDKIPGGALLSFGGIHPGCENYKEILRNLKASGIKGIKLHPPDYEIDIDDIRCLRIIEYASELGLIIITHAGYDLSVPGDRANPVQIEHMLREVHPRNMILAHMGGFEHWDGVEELLCDKDVYLDTSYSVIPTRKKHSARVIPELSKEQFIRMTAKKGIDRILFASDSPWGNQSETLELVRSYIEPQYHDAVLCQNALKLLKGNT